ncbi:hypothetical protein B0H17DRAFT_1103657 [Mycena rosella]|uniref:Secreted protein n=1 Tax=Mycena rosella TaxID=1033263 RepID=A0AAD7FY90_MYCRO|nr:hypothetical protein B0H17DRAFT_1103657 [Mycena rosella]
MDSRRSQAILAYTTLLLSAYTARTGASVLDVPRRSPWTRPLRDARRSMLQRQMHTALVTLADIHPPRSRRRRTQLPSAPPASLSTHLLQEGN